MAQHGQFAARRPSLVLVASCGLLMLASLARCSRAGPSAPASGSASLRIGIGGLPQLTPQAGLAQVVSNLSSEGLIAPYEDGRPAAWLAESWTTSTDGLVLTIRLRQRAKFHDGSPVTASIVAESLRRALPALMGPAFQEDVDRILPIDETQLEIRLKKPSRLLLEALEISIRKAKKDGTIGTGPYELVSSSPSELRANPDYYLGRPTIDRIELQTYPSVRTAWAELLRGNLDALYEVNIDALDSLQASNNVAVFSYLRHYQYVIVFGNRISMIKAASIRRALNAAIDRQAIVRDVLSGHGIPSIGPVPPQHWALEKSAPRLEFVPALAKELASKKLRFTCLVPADTIYERMALAVKQQLAAASVDMQVEELEQDRIVPTARSKDFEAILIDVVSGPSMFRSYRHLYSNVPFDLKPAPNPLIDAALDRIRHATSDDEYRKGVADLQSVVVQDPPEIFLVWGERARAVSRRFEIVMPEDGHDAFNRLRLWRPATVSQLASRN
jgi:peptide/nickel transport system substrate-binding protein